MPRYIDADSAINDLCGSQCGCTINECGLEEPCEKARCILKQPTADVQEVKHGRWINCTDYKKIDDVIYYGYTICSVCEKMQKYGYKTKYCPNCGAKMDGGEQK